MNIVMISLLTIIGLLVLIVIALFLIAQEINVINNNLVKIIDLIMRLMVSQVKKRMGGP